MAITTITRDSQIRKTTGYAWVANASDGTMSDFSLTASRAVITDSNGSPSVSATTSTELGYVSGVTSSIQTQLNGKLSLTGGTLTGNLTLANQHAVIFQDTGSNTVTLEAPTSISSSYSIFWPTAQGGSNTVLTNDGSGNLSWAAGLTSTLTSAHIFVGNGSNVATSVLMSGDVHIDNTGSTTIQAAVVTGSKIASTTITNTNIASGTFSAITGVGTQSQALDMGNNLINNVTDPLSAQDAATKHYVDNLVQGLNWKETTRTASTANLTATYNNGTAGVGATLTNSGTQVALVLDGVTVAVNDRVLIKDQSTTFQNGIYVVTNTGSGSTNWVLTRSTDANTPANLQWATLEVGPDSSTQAGYIYRESDDITTIGTDAVVFTLVSQGISYSFGNGLQVISNVVSVLPADSSISVTGSGVSVALASTSGLVTSSGLSVKVDNSTLDINGSNQVEVKSGGITNTQVSASAAIDFSKLAVLTSAHILVGNGSNVAASVAMTGDVSITNAGVTSISGGIGNHLSNRETPSGTINGSNVTFTLAHTPNPVGGEMIFLNGLLQNAGGSNDYTISGATITYNVAPESGSVLLVTYWY